MRFVGRPFARLGRLLRFERIGKRVCDEMRRRGVLTRPLGATLGDLLTKPVDAPYGPYFDKFSELQHKYGPFAPIRSAIARLKPGGGAR